MICLIVLLVNLILICFVFNSLCCCLVNEVWGLVKICLKLLVFSVLSLMWIGKWFCSFGIMFDGLVIWNVLDVINNMWLVLIMLCLVFIVEFLINGSKLCCIFLWLILGLDVLLCL